MKKVSVLIPVYNVENYVEDAINSIINQSYNNIELIVIDDASTDKTFNIIERLSLEHENIKIFRNKINMGISRTLNFGLIHCSGDYIARADGDDLQDPYRIQKQIEFLESNPSYGVVGCWIVNIDEAGKDIGCCKYPLDTYDVKKCLRYTSPVLHIWTAKKSVYDNLGGYRDTNPAEDYDFVLRCISRGIDVGNIPYFGAKIRLRTGNTLTESSLKQRIVFNYLKKAFIANRINSLEIPSEVARLKANGAMYRIHRCSSFFLKKALEKKNSIQGIIFLTLSFMSPYTVQDVVRRLKFKTIINKMKY